MASPRNLVFCYENEVFRPLRAAAIAGKSSGILDSGPTPDCISHTKTKMNIDFHSISMILSKSIKYAQIIGFNATLDNLWAADCGVTICMVRLDSPPKGETSIP